MKTTPNCKINLGLRVVRKRPDGYHDLETVFLPVPLCDDLEINPADTLRFTADGIAIDCAPEDNICLKAYRILKADHPDLPAVHIHLGKHIPFGAGLGGGSSDAAFTLCMLNEMFALGLSNAQLKAYAASVGADCAFFVDNRPALAEGIGDILTPLGFDPTRGLQLVLAKPDDAVSTREAYGGLKLADPAERQPLAEVLRKPVTCWRDEVENDFERSVFTGHPAIAALKQLFYDHGALYASMTGSGAAVFGLFPADQPLPSALLAALGSTLLYPARP